MWEEAYAEAWAWGRSVLGISVIREANVARDQ